MLVKVCGITNLEDALLAVEYGANALGFNFYRPSPRYLDFETAFEIIDRLPEGILKVGIWVSPLPDPFPKVVEILDALQLYGMRGESEVPRIQKRILIATSPAGAASFPGYEIVLDTSWGRGRLGDWKAIQQLERSYILSGGLTPENVRGALRRLRPAGVDVCSGVEREPGKKDPEKMKAFLAAVRREAEIREEERKR